MASSGVTCASEPLARNQRSSESSLDAMNLLDQLTELRNIIFTRSPIYCNRLSQEEPDGRDAQGDV